MPPPPFASVVIPTFNRDHKIMGSLRSVLEQSFQDFEILVVDDGSPPRIAGGRNAH